MREIKFRAWDKVKEKWYKNVLPLSDGMFLIEDINGYKEVVSIPSFINDRAPNEFAIMQFTGLKDKNGKEIYEGDIVRNLHFNSMAQVVWKECEPAKHSDKYEDLEGFISNLGEFEFVGIGGRTKAFYINEFEVIGNIYENPELLNNK